MNHTPTPWKLDSTKIQSQQWALGGIAIKSYRKDYDEYCAFNQLKGVKLDEDMANAAFIVRACNSHEDLVKAILMLREENIKQAERLGERARFSEACSYSREALAKAGITL